MQWSSTIDPTPQHINQWRWLLFKHRCHYLPQSRSTHHQPYHGSPTASAASDKKWNPLNPLGIVGRHFKADEPHLRIAMCWWVRRMMWRWAWCVGETGSHADAPAPNCWWVRLGLLVNWVHLLLSSGDAPAEWKEDQQIKSLGNNLLEEMSAWFPSMRVMRDKSTEIMVGMVRINQQ